MISILGEKEAMCSLGVRLRSHRLARNLSQQYLADMVGVTVPTYRKMETGDGT
ncbi:MAG: helix-turn-helix transcriptional regulator, partial [Terrimicrobiaceae bacterium]